jgi:hypothetical protein
VLGLTGHTGGQGLWERYGEVLQIAQETIYVNLGRNSGIVEGQTLTVVRNGREIARLKVVRLADRFSACETFPGSGVVRAKDTVTARVAAAPPEAAAPAVPDSLEKPTFGGLAPLAGAEAASVGPQAAQPTQLHGKVALRYAYTNDGSSADRDVHQPAALVSFQADGVGGTPLQLSARMRMRHTALSNRSARSYERPAVRVYDLALSYAPETGPVGFWIGRLGPREMAGVGEFDGALVTARLGSGMVAGVFGGFQPDYATSGFDRNASKAGVYLHHERDKRDGYRQTSTVGLVGQYYRGAVDREYLYLQNTFWLGPRLSLFHLSELDFDRTDRSARLNAIQLSNAYVSMQIRPSRKWSAGLGYDARRYLPLPSAYAAEDSLLDAAFRQGMRADLSLRPARGLFLYARANLRLREDDERVRALAAGCALSNPARTGVTVRTRVTVVQGGYSNARDLQLTVSRNVGRNLNVDLEWGLYRSRLSSADGWRSRRRLAGRVMCYLSRRSILSLSHDIYRGDLPWSHTFVELGVRY